MERVVIFDFGGVIAEEGFQEGLKTIAREHGLDEKLFFDRARDLVYQTGYVTGEADEHAYWQAVREEFSLTVSDEDLRREVLERFTLRPDMLAIAADLGARGITVVLLTDQTDWFAKLDRKSNGALSAPFRFVYNSYDLHMSKRQPEIFGYVERALQVAADDILFVDDNPENVALASRQGWKTILFRDHDGFRQELDRRMGD